jgi:hypothetical protein
MQDHSVAPGQIQQCSNCLRLASTGCPGKGNGKACEATGKPRTWMSVYMEFVKTQHGYRSLKARYFEQFPTLGGTGTSGLNDMTEKGEEGDEDEILPMNPIVEKDKEICDLKKSLDECRKEVSDITALKDHLVKTKSELRNSRRATSLARNKIEFARNITEQRLSNSITGSGLVGEDAEELIALYSTLVDEEHFELGEDDMVSSKYEFLSAVEEKLKLGGDNPEEKKQLENVKNKILEKVKERKCERRSRRDSVCSTSRIKRGNSEHSNSSSSRPKLESQ